MPRAPRRAGPAQLVSRRRLHRADHLERGPLAPRCYRHRRLRHRLLRHGLVHTCGGRGRSMRVRPPRRSADPSRRQEPSPRASLVRLSLRLRDPPVQLMRRRPRQWPTTAAAIGVRWMDGTLLVEAPFGTDDLLAWWSGPIACRSRPTSTPPRSNAGEGVAPAADPAVGRRRWCCRDPACSVTKGQSIRMTREPSNRRINLSRPGFVVQSDRRAGRLRAARWANQGRRESS